MADRMEFPKTMKEFIKGYSFKDSDEIYTNGSELVPVFRVEQALEHYEKEIKNKAIDEFAKRLKAEHEGLITNLGKPYAITFEKIDEIAAEMRGAE